MFPLAYNVLPEQAGSPCIKNCVRRGMSFNGWMNRTDEPEFQT
jgi:hypothetical protein